ncbi:TerC family protein [Sandaracinobacteroides saxicola]|uniref:TerC family protein n=1 Tax=Sandaracinobacteroides saxicola TaxID=2759707 RepID=A0A7G5IKC0_9SPHN|nr:TerC family protein [Sandaracinobacteroides saxicola]QMW23812.1 TerC family protein [Sandaracinobacteroides saxicola]
MDVLTYEWLTKPLWLWFSFIGVVIVLLAFDLGVLHKDNREIEVKESLILSAFYITLGVAYSGFVWWAFEDARAGATAAEAATLLPGFEAAKLYLTGFVIEKSLAMDNVFVIAMIFTYFAIPRVYQHRVLFWGILGVIVLRAIMIGLGATLVSQFAWVMYIFAVFLIYTGVMMWVTADKEYNVGESKVLKFVKKRFRVTDELHGDRFFVEKPDPQTGRMVRWMTPLMLALIMIEIVDVIFAVDSVPAIFAITTDPFIVYTSNIFAILGLRALYFALAALVHRFHYLKYALAVLLVFIGSKIFVADLLGFEGGKFPASWSLSITFVILFTGIGWSLWKTRDTAPEATPKTTVGYPLGGNKPGDAG